MGTIKSEVAFQTTSASRVKFVRIFVFVVAGMAGLLFGLDQGVISGALPFIAKEWELTSRLQEWVVSSMMVGAAIGAIIASKLSSGIGRKKSLMIGAALFIVGCLGSGMATSVEMLIGARLILGLSVGIASYTAPLYLAEMSDKDARGSIISGYQLMVTVGILVAFLSDTYFSYTGDWRAMLMVIAIPAVALILCVLALPESPRWLASKGRFQESANVLSSMHTNVEIAKTELHDIKENLKDGEGMFIKKGYKDEMLALEQKILTLDNLIYASNNTLLVPHKQKDFNLVKRNSSSKTPLTVVDIIKPYK